MTDRETVINVLNAAIDTAFAANCELVKVPVNIAIHAVDMLKPKKRESRAMLPCKCGGVRREHWYGIGSEILVCKRCGFKVFGKNRTDAIRKWNEAVRLD